ncbi:hypothetical protein [Helicobacter winghamensis]|uniref:hypothetical protein n=1 Tax=Helicobacter winghamensis TaxID=157268 RepID=UPI00117B83CD|nr:hypothetical protein [Helicobacter winghamensis]
MKIIKSQSLEHICMRWQMARVALCISGAFRGEDFIDNLRDIIGEFKSLKVDVFIASWDTYKAWMGLTGGIPGWFRIQYSKNIVDIAPQEFVANNSEFKERCPNIYKILNRECGKKITNEMLKKIKKLPNVKGVCLSNEEEFSSKYPMKLDCKTSTKLAFNYSRILKLLLDYEKKNCFYYDYIIMVRPDIKYVKNFGISFLQTLSDKQLVIPTKRNNMSSHEYFALGKRYAMIEFLSVFYKAKQYRHLEFFKFFPSAILCYFNLDKAGAFNGSLNHILQAEYLKFLGLELINGRPIMPYFRISLNPKMVLLDKALEEDKKHWRDIGLRDFGYFFEVLRCEKILKSDTAKKRIKNQLSYKFGRAMVENSLFKLPFVLLKIKQEHQKDEALYRKLLSRYSNLKLPPLESYSDYQDALKCKNHLSYKLGEALIKAHKNWHKGGYIKLWFDIAKIKKEHKNKKAKNENG